MKSRFIKLLMKMVKYHSIYLWGAQGELVNQLSTETIINMETSEKNALRVIDFIALLNAFGMVKKETRAFDCSGLICWCLVLVGKETQGFDTTADGLFAKYKHTTKLRRGVLVHRKGHIGCYIGYNHVIEAKGRDYGVVISPYNASDWDKEFADPWAS